MDKISQVFMPILTRRQKQIFDFISEYINKHEVSPTFKEIKRRFKLRALSTVHQHIETLIDKGYLNKNENSRGVEVKKSIEDFVSVTLAGTITAGQPIEVIEEKETIAIPKINLPHGKEIFALKVIGNSMIQENINDGDIVLIKKQPYANNGDRVVALIDNTEATLKKIFIENNKIRLQPANAKYKPIFIEPENLLIQGVVIDVIKNYTEEKIFEKNKSEKKGEKNIQIFLNKVIEGDCLKIMKEIPEKSIDMILCDLPYGFTQNEWDSHIPLDLLWKQYERIIKDNGVIALTAQGLFTARLIMSNPKLFKYKIVWVKSKPTNFLNAKKQPLRKHEDIVIFYKNQAQYNPQMSMSEPYYKGFRKDQLSGSYGDFKTVEVKSNGERYPTDVVYFKTAESEGKVYHPTQKPIELGRYLIRTFTKEGDVVLDNTCGSGSFLVSAVLEGRKFIGIEKNEEVYLFKKHEVDYIDICKRRIKEAEEKYKIESNKLF